MDIKIGHKVYGPDASLEKRTRADTHLWPTQKPCGFKISGILAHSLRSEDEGILNVGGRVYSKKSFGQKLTPDTIWKVPEAFYDSEYLQQPTHAYKQNISSLCQAIYSQRGEIDHANYNYNCWRLYGDQ